MPEIQESIVVEGPVSKVWGVFEDFGGADAWHPYFDRAYLAEGSPESGLGAARICEFGPKMAIKETVTVWEVNRTMTIAIDFLKGPPSPLKDVMASVEIEPHPESGTTLTLRMHYSTSLGPLGWVMGKLFVEPMYRGVFRNMLAAAKGYAERGERPEPIVMMGSGRVLSAA